MRHALIVGLVAPAVISTAAAHIKPADTSKPLFRILKFQTLHGGDHPQGVANGEHPLLVVWSLGNVQLARDNKGVLITLTPKDTKTFASITLRYGYLIFDAGEGRPIEVLHITAPIIDGVIGFKHPEEATAAEYLRRRLLLGEFKSSLTGR
jgi:hypothetical protein